MAGSAVSHRIQLERRHRGIATNGAALSVFLHGDSSSFVSVQSTVGGVAVSCGTKQHRQNLWMWRSSRSYLSDASQSESTARGSIIKALSCQYDPEGWCAHTVSIQKGLFLIPSECAVWDVFGLNISSGMGWFFGPKSNALLTFIYYGKIFMKLKWEFWEFAFSRARIKILFIGIRKSFLMNNVYSFLAFSFGRGNRTIVFT